MHILIGTPGQGPNNGQNGDGSSDPSGATPLFNLSMSGHVLIAGKSGQGKSHALLRSLSQLIERDYFQNPLFEEEREFEFKKHRPADRVLSFEAPIQYVFDIPPQR